MKSLSGDYPEVWIVYDEINTMTGETTRKYKQITGARSPIVGYLYFKQRPPRLPELSIGKIYEVKYWKSPTEVTGSTDLKFIWRTY